MLFRSAWVLFRANSLTDAMAVYSAVFRWMANIPRLGLGLSLGDVGISKKALLMLGVFSVGMLGADWFIWIAIAAAVIAAGAIAFGYWRAAKEKQAEAEYIEVPAAQTAAATASEGALQPEQNE